MDGVDWWSFEEVMSWNIKYSLSYKKLDFYWKSQNLDDFLSHKIWLSAFVYRDIPEYNPVVRKSEASGKNPMMFSGGKSV